jgi:hypothetical protein
MNQAQRDELANAVDALNEGAARGIAAAVLKHPKLAGVRGMLHRMGRPGEMILGLADDVMRGNRNAQIADAGDPTNPPHATKGTPSR